MNCSNMCLRSAWALPCASDAARVIISIAVLAAITGTASSASAVTIALWTFETSPPLDQSNVAIYPNAIAPDFGAGNAGGEHTSASTDWTTPDGNGSANSFNSNVWDANNFYQFSVLTTGYQDITISWDQTRSSTSAPAKFDLLYSSAGTGGPFSVGLDDYTVLVNSPPWNTSTTQPAYSFLANLSGVPALDNNANVVFRLSAVVGATNANATVRVDNFLVSGVPIPEPATWTLVLLGLCGVVPYLRRLSR